MEERVQKLAMWMGDGAEFATEFDIYLCAKLAEF